MKKILLTLIISTFGCIKSMEQENHYSNIMALTSSHHESEEQFITRTKKVTRNIDTNEWMHLCSYLPRDTYCKHIHFGVSPDDNKCIMLQNYYIKTADAVSVPSTKHPDFIIFDISNGVNYAQILCRGQLNEKHHMHITLSQSGKMLALIHRGPFRENKPCKFFLSIENIDTQTTIKEFKIPKNFDTSFARLNFNKQDTHVIVHGKIDLGHGETKQHLIFPLKED